jgi:hypothetical protein
LRMVRRVEVRELIGVLEAMLGVDLAYSIDYMGQKQCESSVYKSRVDMLARCCSGALLM